MRRYAFALILTAALPLAAQTVLTLYNQRFAVIRETLPLDLKQGTNQVRHTGVTSFVEPESVILRDPSGKVSLRVLEQNYLADPVSLENMLTRHEGQTIQFEVRQGERTQIVEGRIVRAPKPLPGIVPVQFNSYQYQQGMMQAGGPQGQPIVEVNGRLQFQLPGLPLFPPLAADMILKPTMEWLLESSAAAKFDAELAYVSGGLQWESDYNVISSAAGTDLDVIGWVTMQNYSGKSFEKARIKLMAGEVAKLDPGQRFMASAGGVIGGIAGGRPDGQQVTEKSFDEYHLYSLERPSDLRNGETKQVEFLRATGIKSKLLYLYDGAKLPVLQGWQPPEAMRQDPSYGTQSNPRVWLMREFSNTKENGLGLPLPQGRIRFYRRDSDGRLEFTGEDEIRHTPQGETVRVFTGAAFDLVGERKRTNFRMDMGRQSVEESFEIRVRNRKTEPVEVLVNERLYRWMTWEIYTSSVPFEKKESQRVEFRLPLQPNEEKVLTYSVRYSW